MKASISHDIDQPSNGNEHPLPLADRPISIPRAAYATGIPAWKLRKAADLGLIPVYYIANTRRLVKPSEILAALNASRKGGQ